MKKFDSKPEIIRETEITYKGIVYKYMLTMNKSKKVASFMMPLYSIKVEMNDNGKLCESEIKDVFCDIGKAIVFYEMLIENHASPYDLHYILEDKILI